MNTKYFTLIPGLLLVTAGVAGAATGTVTIDFGAITGFGTPFLFGGCAHPRRAQAADVYPQMTNSGVVFVKSDFLFEAIIPTNKCASVEDFGNGSTGTMLPQSYPFKILSNRPGLGRGNFQVCGISNQTIIDACTAVNSAGQKVAFIVSYYDSMNTVNLSVQGLKGSHVTVVEYWADSWDPACAAYKTVTNDVAAGRANYTVNMQPNTCVGLTFALIQ